jgi:hypothetical protein
MQSANFAELGQHGRTKHGGKPRETVNRRQKHGDIAETHKDFRVLGDEVVVEPFEKLVGVASADATDDRPDLVIRDEVYEYTDRGTISVQTVGDPFQLYFANEWNPPAPLQAIRALKADIAAGFHNIEIKPGLPVKCNRYAILKTEKPDQDPWTDSTMNSEAVCPTGSVPLSGGCDMTCFSLVHTSSLPTASGWQCKAVSTDETREYKAVALCLHLSP